MHVNFGQRTGCQPMKPKDIKTKKKREATGRARPYWVQAGNCATEKES